MSIMMDSVPAPVLADFGEKYGSLDKGSVEAGAGLDKKAEGVTPEACGIGLSSGLRVSVSGAGVAYLRKHEDKQGSEKPVEEQCGGKREEEMICLGLSFY